MINIIRNNCVLCKGKLKQLYTIKNFPIYMGVSSDSKDLYSDKAFATCIDCGCVQLKKLIPLDLLYAKSHNAAIGKTGDRDWETPI